MRRSGSCNDVLDLLVLTSSPSLITHARVPAECPEHVDAENGGDGLISWTSRDGNGGDRECIERFEEIGRVSEVREESDREY